MGALLGFADLGCYGGRAAQFGAVSPVLDAMAAAGIRFTQGYSNSPVCSPTRFALMTGRYQYRLRGAAGEPINSRSRGSVTLGLPPDHPSLPSLLRASGYRTALIGKWGYPPHFGPLRSGYEAFYGLMSGGVDYFISAIAAGMARTTCRRCRRLPRRAFPASMRRSRWCCLRLAEPRPFVVGEIACGSLADRGLVLELLQDLPAAPMAESDEVLGFIDRHELHGKGIGVVDVHLLASVALTEGSKLRARDKRLLAAAEALGFAFQRYRRALKRHRAARLDRASA